jgi:site-specific recombinase XerC
VLGGYDGWLACHPLAARTREAYLAQVRDFVTWLEASEHGAQALSDPNVRDWAVRDYKRYVKTSKRWGPASVNQALAAIDNFYRSLGAGRPEVAREELAQTAPRALVDAEQRSFLRFVAASPSARDRAIATVFFYAGLRLSELAALDMTDVALSARRGRVTVRAGKGDAYRDVPLNSPCRTALDEWFDARTKQLATRAQAAGGGAVQTSAVWLSRSGTRMGSRAIDLVSVQESRGSGGGVRRGR